MRLERPEGDSGVTAVVSVTRSTSGVPYVAAEEEKTRLPTPASFIASSRLIVPVTFSVYVCSGRFTLSPAYLNAARWTTPVTSWLLRVSRSAAVSRMEHSAMGENGSAHD